MCELWLCAGGLSLGALGTLFVFVLVLVRSIDAPLLSFLVRYGLSDRDPGELSGEPLLTLDLYPLRHPEPRRRLPVGVDSLLALLPNESRRLDGSDRQ